MSYIEIIGNKVILKPIRTNKIVLVILLVLSIVGLAIPVIAVIFLISQGERPKIGLAFSFVLFWGSAFYFFRLFSWNSSGRDEIIFNKEDIQFVSRSNFIKFQDKSIDRQLVRFSLHITRQKVINSVETEMANLVIENDDDSIRGNVELPKNEILELIKNKL